MSNERSYRKCNKVIVDVSADGCYVVVTGKQVKTFQKNIIPLFGGSAAEEIDFFVCLTLKMKVVRFFETSTRPNITEYLLLLSSAYYGVVLFVSCTNL